MEVLDYRVKRGFANDAKAGEAGLLGDGNGWKLCLFGANLGKPLLVNPMAGFEIRGRKSQ